MHGKVAQWTSIIIENVLKELAVANGENAKKGLQKFKYVGALLPALHVLRRRRAWLCPRSHRVAADRARAPPIRTVTCQMQQRTGAAMITACAGYWDKNTDGYCATKWESDQVQALVTVFGVAV